MKKIADQLIEHGHVVRSGRAFLGVRVAVDGKPTVTSDVLVSVLAQLRPGQKIPVKLVRGKRRLTVTVSLGELRG